VAGCLRAAVGREGALGRVTRSLDRHRHVLRGARLKAARIGNGIHQSDNAALE